MDSFKQKFIEEANDNIQELEKALLELETDKENPELIERVFRAMHSLKGGGAMFGFTKISEFTHNLETIYDYIRNGKTPISVDILTITLAAVDHIKLLLENEDAITEEIEDIHNDLVNQILKITSSLKSIETYTKSTDAEKSDKSNGTCTYIIHFVPEADIFDNGTNPLYLIDELMSLGDGIAIPNTINIPPLRELSPLRCYTSWNIFLATDQPKEAINDIFIFVEDDCQLEISKISNQNLISNKKFKGFILDLKKQNEEISLADILDFVGNIEQRVSNKVKKVIEHRNKLITKENSISSIRVTSDKLDNLMNLVSELVTTQARLSLVSDNIGNGVLSTISENIQKLTRQLRDNAFSILLIPIESTITRFQRLVRDLSNELNKKIRFVAEGTDTELDKTIIENLTDPLMHIIRNSVDHGIEDEQTRIKKGKPAEGTVLFKSYYSGANVHIEITDDGAGIDEEFIRKKAIKKGIISPENKLTTRETLDLIFLPGFSTAKNVTDVSGRGVGMDVVKKKIHNIRGEVEVISAVDKGTTIGIKLPLTLSIIDGLLVKLDDDFYIIPLNVVDKIYAIKHTDVINKFNNLMVLDGRQVAFFNLRKEFKMPECPFEDENIVLIKNEDRLVGLTVDSVIGEYQAVLKPLGQHYRKQEIISGATILGDGTIALILDTNKAVKMFSSEALTLETHET